MKILTIAFFLITLLIFTCNTSKNAPPEGNTGENWQPQLHDIWVLTSINDKKVSTGNRPRLELFPKDGRMGGNGGCNEIFGNIEASATSIKFSQIGATKKYCADTMDMEIAFTKTLQEVDEYTIKSLKLYLSKDGEILMELQKVD